MAMSVCVVVTGSRGRYSMRREHVEDENEFDEESLLLAMDEIEEEEEDLQEDIFEEEEEKPIEDLTFRDIEEDDEDDDEDEEILR